MTTAESDTPHEAVAAYVTKHHDSVEMYADSDKNTAWLAEALLGRERTDFRADGGEQR